MRMRKAPRSFWSFFPILHQLRKELRNSFWGAKKSIVPKDHLMELEGYDVSVADFYAQHIQPKIVPLEEQRKDAMRKSNQRKFVSLFLLFLPGMVMMVVSGMGIANLGFFALWLLFAASIVYITMLWPRVVFRSKIREEIFPLILSYFGSDFRYSHDGGMPMQPLEASNLMPNHNEMVQEDYVSGSYKGVRIEMVELLLKEHIRKQRRDGQTETETREVFRGFSLLLSMQKQFEGKTIVSRDGGRIGNFLRRTFSGKKLQVIQLEDPTFEKLFEVYGSDQVEARYLLTPAFMERLLHLEAMVRGELDHADENVMDKLQRLNRRLASRANRGVQASFFDNQLLLLIPSTIDRFEVGDITRPLTLYEEMNTILSEMKDITAIIETLKLHEHTGL